MYLSINCSPNNNSMEFSHYEIWRSNFLSSMFYNPHTLLCLSDKSLRTASFWLSATDLSESNSYVWMTMGDKVSDQPWLPRPDSSSNHDPLTGISKHCMGLRYNETANSSTVNEEVCSDYNNYICVNRGGSKCVLVGKN